MSDLDQIKQKIDIVAFVSESVPLKKTGANFKGLCPFHTEKTPSFIVSPERQIWHCFGQCADGGDIFKFLMKIENIEFSESLKILAKRAGVTLSAFQPSKESQLKEKLYSVNHLASEFYHYILTNHPLGQKARDYLKSRQITNNSITLFSLGYSPNSWDSLINFLAKKGYNPPDLETAGLVSKSQIGHFFDRFRGRLIFTLKDHRGNCVGFAGRLLDPEAKEAKYVNTAETPVYTKGNILYGLEIAKEEIKKEGFAVVVEGEIDAIQSYQAGVRNVVAIKGSALTQNQVNLLKRYTENIYLSLDADYAGDSAAHRGIEIADAAGLNIKVVNLKEGKDPDELIKKDPGLWHEAVKKAINFYDFIIDSALAKFDPKIPEQAKKIVSEVAHFLEPIENLVVKNHYLKKLAGQLDISQDALAVQLAKEYKKTVFSLRPITSPITNDQTPITPKSRSDLLEEYLLSLLLQSPRPSDHLLLISPRLTPQDFTNPASGKIYQLLISLSENPQSDVSLPQDFNINTFVKIAPPELAPIIDRLYLLESAVSLDTTAVLTELQKTAWEIRELSLRDKLKKITQELKAKQESKDLVKDFTETTSALQKLLEEKSLLKSPS